MATRKNLFLVLRLAWCTTLHEASQRGVCYQHESAQGVPVRAFNTKPEASKYAERLTAEARRELNPFQFTYAGVSAITEVSEENLCRAIARLGHPVWISKCFDWARWYDEVVDTLTDPERDAIWNLLDRLELYRVVEVEFL